MPGADAARVREVLLQEQDVLGYDSFDVNPNVGKVAVVGVGMTFMLLSVGSAWFCTKVG